MRIFLPLLILLTVAGCVRKAVKKRGLAAPKAMVVSAHPLASAIGKEVLLRGGNAMDAAVAVQFALAVVYPEAGNIGGGGFLVLRQKDGRLAALDYRETAPATATRNMYLDKNGKVIPDLSLKGHLAAGVPGTVDGMVQLHRKYGKLPWPDLVQPAIDLASKGFSVSRLEARNLDRHQDDFRNFNTRPPDFILKKNWRENDIFMPEGLARTLTLIRDFGREGFYSGPTADSIVAEMQRGKGLITHNDLKNYQSVWREPVTGFYKNYRVISMPPPSSGGIALLQLLSATEEMPLQKWGFQSTATAHAMVEAERRVYADRAKHLGDPDFYRVPQIGLLDKAYIKKRMADFNPEKATPSKEISPGTPAPYESPNTTHYSIVDPEGNAISVTTTLNSNYGSRVFVAGCGFLLNNEMDDFSAKPGFPNNYGLVGGEANAIAPRKRMLSSMTPTILEKDGKLFLVLGSPGGSTIITTVYQVVLNVTEFGMGMQEAVNAKRYHHQWKPDIVMTEPGTFSAKKLAALWKMGHKVVPQPKPYGRVDAILVSPDGTLEAGADPRGDDAAAGF